MISIRYGLVFFGVILNITSVALLCICIAGFSLDEDVVKNTYWIYAKQPDWETAQPVTAFGDDFLLTADVGKVDSYEIELYYGLRMYVAECTGSNCNFDTESYMWQSCDYDDDAGPFKSSDVCKDCRFAGQAAGSYAIWSFVLLLVGVGLLASRSSEQKDHITLRMSGIAVHVLVMIFQLVGTVLFITECYDNLSGLYENDDIVKGDDVEYEYGPALQINIVVLCLQPILIIFHAVLTHRQASGEYDADMSGRSDSFSCKMVKEETGMLEMIHM